MPLKKQLNSYNKLELPHLCISSATYQTKVPLETMATNTKPSKLLYSNFWSETPEYYSRLNVEKKTRGC